MKNILVAVDGSQQSLAAVRFTAGIFDPEQIEIVLLMVMNRMPEAYFDVARSHCNGYYGSALPFVDFFHQRESEAEEFMTRAKRIFLDAGFSSDAVRAHIQYRKQGVARDILARAKREKFRAIIVGRTGRSKFKDFMLGSTAHKIIEQISDVPVWTIGGAPATDRILAAVDASKTGYRILDYIAEMFAGRNISITLFHAARELDSCRNKRKQLFDEQDEEKWHQLIENKMRFIFDEAILRLVRAGINRDNISIKLAQKVASRAAAIIQEARTGLYGTIIAGRKGLTQANGFMMGRVSTKLIQNARDMAVCIVN